MWLFIQRSAEKVQRLYPFYLKPWHLLTRLRSSHRCGFSMSQPVSVLTDSSYLWRDCSWREPGAPRIQAPERRISEQQHPPTPFNRQNIWQKRRYSLLGSWMGWWRLLWAQESITKQFLCYRCYTWFLPFSCFFFLSTETVDQKHFSIFVFIRVAFTLTM